MADARHKLRGSGGRFAKAEVARPIVSLSQPVPVLRGRFDAAQTTTDNSRHWVNADNLSANAAMTKTIQRTIRQRARYEVANNSWAKGIVETLANDLVGKGPRLQILTKNRGVNTQIAKAFTYWAQSIKLGAKLRQMRRSKAVDGEAFGVLSNSADLGTPVTLDLRLIESDQVTTPTLLMQPKKQHNMDGIVLDNAGKPISYHVLDKHPGDRVGTHFNRKYKTIPVKDMIHYFQADRPGQSRGLPDIMPALTIFADIRRFSQATIAAAESAADFAAVMKTNSPASSDADDVTPLESLELEKRMLLSLPAGWDMQQFKAEHPNTSYTNFIRAKIAEAARCLCMPFNVAFGNSEKYNYASGRLDHQTYFKNIEVDRSVLEVDILDRIFAAWLAEAILITNYLPLPARLLGPISHQWFWPGREHVDPAKEANAQKIRLENKTTTLAIEYGLKGLDWETQLEQRIKEEAREMELRKQYGVPAPIAVAAPAGKVDDDEED